MTFALNLPVSTCTLLNVGVRGMAIIVKRKAVGVMYALLHLCNGHYNYHIEKSNLTQGMDV